MFISVCVPSFCVDTEILLFIRKKIKTTAGVIEGLSTARRDSFL